MSLTRSPKLVKAGLVLLDPETAQTVRVVAFQFNPENLSRSYEIKGAGEGSRSEPLRLLGPPVETFTLDILLDASDQLERPDQNPDAVESGIHGPLAVLESLIYPDSAAIEANRQLAAAGELEILPMEKYLTLFAWGQRRVLPVRVTQLTVNEEDFDPDLNPIRAHVSLGLRVLTVDDLGFDHRGGSLYLRHHQAKERLAGRVRSASLTDLGSISIS